MVNSSTMTLIVIVMAIYFIGMIAISWMGRKYGKNFDDFISATAAPAASRKLRPEWHR